MNPIVHFEIQADDLDRAEKFYKDVFGWRFMHLGAEFGNYRTIMTGKNPDQGPAVEGINGGMMKRNAPVPENGKSPNAFTCIISVDNIDTYIQKIEAAGGVAQTDKMNVPGVGDLRYYKDTEGNIFGILQPAPRQQ